MSTRRLSSPLYLATVVTPYCLLLLLLLLWRLPPLATVAVVLAIIIIVVVTIIVVISSLLLSLPSDNVQHELSLWSIKTFLKETDHRNKGNLCTRSSYLLCLLPSMLCLRYSICCLSSLLNFNMYSLHSILKSYQVSSIHPHAIGVGLSSPLPLLLLDSCRPLQ